MKANAELKSAQQRAVVYGRVSSISQTKRGDGLGSQETRCREYAKFKNYDIIQVFTDDKTGKDTDRPGLKALLCFLKKHRHEQLIVLIDDISRLARNVEAHWELRRSILRVGGKLESPSTEFKQDADSRMVENFLAGAAQHQREKNAEQTFNRMRARLLNGYWVFWKVRGYRYKKTPDQGKMLVRDEPLASIVQEALEGFASRRFATQAEVKRFLENQPEFPKDLPNGEIRNQRITDLLKQPLYAGYLEVPNWDITFRKAKHEPLISLETYEKIQQRLKGNAVAPARKDNDEQFPLRGFVLCADCEKPLTACWSKSKSGKKHPYYLCFNRDCTSHRKSIPRHKIEGDFEAILQRIQPGKQLAEIAKAMFEDAWNQRANQAKEIAASLQKQVQKTERQIENLVDRIVDTDNARLIATYEERLSRLEKEKLFTEEKLALQAKPKYGFAKMFEHAMTFLANPWNIWVSGQEHGRKIVLRLCFSERLAYSRESGFRTPKTTLPFNVLEGFSMGNCEMAHLGRFEPRPPDL